MIDAPNLVNVEKCLTDNTIFMGDDVEVVLNVNTEVEGDIFEISLNATRKSDFKRVRIETRVALEKHLKGQGHYHPHLQINNFASNEEILGKGKLHILLLVKTREELEECCEGFVYILSKIMDIIKDLFNISSNLKEHFFYLESLKELEINQKILQNLIVKSFKINKLIYENEELNLIEYKGKKNDEPLDTTNYFKILRILLHLKVLNPLLLEPLYEIIFNDPQIISKCKKVSFGDFKKILGSKSSDQLQHYNRDRFIQDFTSI